MTKAPAPPALVRARVAVFAAFFTLGGGFAQWVTRVPAVKAELGLRDGELGLALFGLAVGVLTGLPVAGRMIARFGSRPVTRVAVLAQCVTLVLPALAWNLVSLAVAL